MMSIRLLWDVLNNKASFLCSHPQTLPAPDLQMAFGFRKAADC
jgi:hypothetical protein